MLSGLSVVKENFFTIEEQVARETLHATQCFIKIRMWINSLNVCEFFLRILTQIFTFARLFNFVLIKFEPIYTDVLVKHPRTYLQAFRCMCSQTHHLQKYRRYRNNRPWHVTLTGTITTTTTSFCNYCRTFPNSSIDSVIINKVFSFSYICVYNYFEKFLIISLFELIDVIFTMKSH